VGWVHKAGHWSEDPNGTPLYDQLKADIMGRHTDEDGNGHADTPGAEQPPERRGLVVGAVSGMDPDTLAEVMGRTAGVNYTAYVDPFNAALRAAQCTTPRRAAMFCAQIGHESLGLYYMQEIASGAAYNGRADLGNLQPGDGPRFKGRGPIQLTGRANYGAFSRWCHRLGLVDTDDYFVRNPALVATARWGFLAASWYWTVARPALNDHADADDIVAATKAVNGGTNGLADRTSRWKRALAMGTRLLPEPEDVMASLDDVRAVLREELAAIARRDDLGYARNQVLAALGSSDPEHAPVTSEAPSTVQQQLNELCGLVAAMQADVAELKTKWASDSPPARG
jgi:predicted chitinase